MLIRCWIAPSISCVVVIIIVTNSASPLKMYELLSGFKHDSMQGLLDMMIAEEESLKQRLMDSIASCRKELQKLSQELQLPPFEVNILVVSSWLVYCKSSLHYSLFLLHQNSRNCQRHSTNCTHHLLYGRGVFEGEVHILSQSTIYSQHSFCCWL